MKKITKYFAMVSILYLSSCTNVTLKKVENRKLDNPTKYSYSFSINKVTDTLSKMISINGAWRVNKVKSQYKLTVYDRHSPYHVVEKVDNDLGVLLGYFDIILKEIDGKTKVLLDRDSLRISVGWERDKYPKRGIIQKEVPSSTFYEYSFLLRLGELLGEKGMPPLKK